MELRADEYWNTIDTWIFVFKSGRAGVPSDVLMKILELDTNTNLNILLFTLEDIFLCLDNKKAPNIPYEVFNQVYSIVTQLKQGFIDTRNEFIEHERNVGMFFSMSESINLNDRYNKMVTMINLNLQLAELYYDYILMWQSIGIGDSIYRLLEIRYPFNEDTITYAPVIYGYESSGDDNLHEERICLCDVILNKINSELFGFVRQNDRG